MISVRLPPTFIVATPSSQPLITRPLPIGNSNGSRHAAHGAVSVAFRWPLTITSEVREYNVHKNGRAFDRITVSGFPENHPEWELQRHRARVRRIWPLPDKFPGDADVILADYAEGMIDRLPWMPGEARSAVIVLASNLITDLVYVYLDPRLRRGA